MTSYYLDPGAADNVTHDGLTTATAWGGQAGWCRAKALVRGGDRLYIRAGTAIDDSRYVYLTGIMSSIGWIPAGASVTHSSGATALVAADLNDMLGSAVVLRVLTGTISGSGTLTLDASNSIDHNGTDSYWYNLGTDTAPPVIVGVNGSWVEDGTRAVFQAGGSWALMLRYNNGAWTFRNCEFNGGSLHGVACYGGTSGLCTFRNCAARSNGHTGFYAFSNARMDRCLAENNGQEGLNVGGVIERCVVIGSGDMGIFVRSDGTVIRDCIVHASTDAQVYIDQKDGIVIEGCVIDGGTSHGIWNYNGSAIVQFNRITLNGGDGILQTTGGWVYEDYNFLHTNDTTGNVEHGGHSVLATMPDPDGYTDRANDDFTLTQTAALRSIAVALPA